MYLSWVGAWCRDCGDQVREGEIMLEATILPTSTVLSCLVLASLLGVVRLPRWMMLKCWTSGTGRAPAPSWMYLGRLWLPCMEIRCWGWM